ncbi:hypothetical protein G9274_002230 [Stenotrophomonas rhizophila]|jgi:hypothetical protein|nr:hypothetical protein G9274_002230 [Stenotrophomonas rhizophila]
MQGGVRSAQYDSLCSALDGIHGRQQLTDFASEWGLHRDTSEESSVEVWKGEAMGAGIEILLLPPAAASGDWGISTLVTVGGRVEHIRRRPFRI